VVLLLMYVHPSRDSTIRQLVPSASDPQVAISESIDLYGNRCGRTVVPAGRVAFRSDAIVEDDGRPGVQFWDAPGLRFT
jgi:hypothetical protein